MSKERKEANAMKTPEIIKKYPGNPILTCNDVPYESQLAFNAGVAKYNGKYVMLFRNDYGHQGGCVFSGCNIGIAFSDDGIHWEVKDKPCFGIEVIGDDTVTRVYDPRITVIDGVCYICFAIDTIYGIRGGIATTEDFEHFDIICKTLPDNRNMVLFPEKANGRYVRLDRPFPLYGRGPDMAFDIWISYSKDMEYWGHSERLLGVEDVPFANNKLGPAAPPIKTEKGWLTLFHSVDYDESRGKNGWEDTWKKRYMAGIMLLDLENPSKIIGLHKEPIIVPDMDYETSQGFRNNVIFPTGMILEDNGEVKIYYGSADTTICLATAELDDLLSLF